MNGNCYAFGSGVALALLIFNSCSTDTLSSSSSNSTDSPPAAIRQIRKTKSSMKVGDIVTLSVDVDNPQGQPVTYYWYNEAVDGENFVNGNFIGSNQSRKVS